MKNENLTLWISDDQKEACLSRRENLFFIRLSRQNLLASRPGQASDNCGLQGRSWWSWLWPCTCMSEAQSWIRTHRTAMSLLYALRPDFGQHQFQKDTVMSTVLSHCLLDSLMVSRKHHRHRLLFVNLIVLCFFFFLSH